MGDRDKLYEIEHEAKSLLGDTACEIIANDLKIEKWDGKKGLSPFREEKTPSFIWNSKDNCFKDFSSGRTYGIIDHFMSTKNVCYLDALKMLCELVGIEVDPDLFSKKKKYGKEVFSKDEPENDREIVEEYLYKRGISLKTLDFCDVKQAENGNIAFQLKDEDNNLISTKYRISHKQKSKEELKWYWQKGCTIHDLLYGVNRCMPNESLVICEGFIDRLSVVEAGYTNVVSIPGGAEADKWIDYNFEFLEQFKDIVLWFDNDQAGYDGRKKVASRLGEYRVRLVNPSDEVSEKVREYYIPYGADIDKTDANNVLLACGPDTILKLINDAEIIENPRLKDLFSYIPVDIQTLPRVSTGFQSLDAVITGNFDGNLIVLSGFSGCVDCDTEYFNGYGWKKISDFIPGEKVLQYTKDGFAELVYPNAYIVNDSKILYRIKTKYGIDQCLSENHNVVYVTSKGNIARKQMKDLMNMHNNSKHGFSGKFITTFGYSGVGIETDEYILRLTIAVMAEGHFKKDLKTNWCRINLKKEHKKERLRFLLKKCGIEYIEKNINPKDKLFSTFKFYAPIKTKSFPKEWYNCNIQQMSIILDEVTKWDGSNNNNSREYYTTNKEDADFIQFVGSSLGHRTSIYTDNRVGKTSKNSNGKMYVRKSIAYSVRAINGNGMCRMLSNKKHKIEEYSTKDGKEYCFNVPSGMLVLRRNDCIFITGNSGKTTMIAEMGIISPVEEDKKVMVFSGEANGGVLLGNTYRPLAGRNHVMEWDNSAKGLPNGYSVTKEAMDCIRSYYKGKIYNYEDGEEILTTASEILSQMEYAYRRYGVTHFVLDNLMCISCVSDDKDEKYESQYKFTLALKRFTRKYNTTVFLVAHAKKPAPGQTTVSMYDVSGASEIINLADRGFSVSRLYNDPEGYSAAIYVMKDRVEGKVGAKVKLKYDKPTNRLYGNEEELFKPRKWENSFKYRYGDFVREKIVGNRDLETEKVQGIF